jgi:hypothetical protein
MIGRHETHDSAAQQRIANLMPLGRPGAECLELAAWPPGTPPETIGDGRMLLDRPHVRLAVR